RYGIFLPLNEWPPTVILGLQAGSTLLDADGGLGVFSEPPFRRAFDFYLGLFRDGLAPPVSNNEIANLYQEFARGTFAMYITGPWNLGEFRRRLPEELQDAWATAPLPGPEPGVPGVSLAGGSSLVIFRDSPRADAAWRLVSFLSRPEQQARFYDLTGDLPAHRGAWERAGIVDDPRARAFRDQLEHVVSTPKVPEWEQIATRVYERGETAVRGSATVEEALTALDEDVARMLDKRRWLQARKARGAAPDGAAPR
ncbi:extracellular solute-binding protein, partial [bacterium]|nr:extracellular solute-binding protein [bacterium]